MKVSWKKCLACAASLALTASAVPAVLISADTAAVPSTDGWEFVMAWDLEDKEPNTSVSTWGGYGDACKDTVLEGIGADGSKGVKVHYDLDKAQGETQYVQPYYAEGPDEVDFTGATELWLWVDMTNYYNPQNWRLRPRIHGEEMSLIPSAPFYMQTADGWKACKCLDSEDPTTQSTIPGADLNGFKGYIRIPLSSFRDVPKELVGLNIGYQIYDFSFATDDMENYIENGFVMDNWLLAGPDMANTAAKPVNKLLNPVPSVLDWQYVMAEDHEGREVGSSYDNWGSYCDNVDDKVLADVGADGTKGLYVSTNAELGKSAYCQPFYVYDLKDVDLSGATELWTWVDMSAYANPGNLKIRPRLKVDGADNDVKMKSGAVYYLQDGEDWKAGHFGVLEDDPNGESFIPAADLTGFKGYIRMPLTSFNDVKEGKLTGYFGAYWIYDFSFAVDDLENYVKNGYTVDNILFAGPSVTGGASVKGLFDGSLAPDADAVTEEMKAAAAAAKDAIAALPALDALTLDDEAAVAAAREKVAAVDEKAIGLVDNLPSLVDAEKKIKELKDAAAADAADKAAAKTVSDLIAALKPAEVTLKDEEAIAAARKAFDGLTAAQQKLVTNAADLEAAEKALAALKNVRPEDPKPEWKYLPVSHFDTFEDGYDFSSERDEQNNYKYMFEPCGTKGKKYGSFITKNGYKGSSAYTMKIKGDDGSYAQPLLRLDQLNGGEPLNYAGAEELTMYVDFTHIKMDSVGLALRLIVNDRNADGTPSGQMTQYGLKEGGYVYMMSPAGNWVKATVTAAQKLPVEVSGRIAMEPGDDFPKGAAEVPGYKGLIRIPVSQMERVSGESSDVNGKMDLESIAQFWMIFNCPDKQDGNYFVIDQMGFDGSFTTAGQGEIDVTDMLPMSSGEAETPVTPETPETPDTPHTGAALPAAMGVLGAGALSACLYLRKKKEDK